jgi:hypothetical protein
MPTGWMTSWKAFASIAKPVSLGRFKDLFLPIDSEVTFWLFRWDGAWNGLRYLVVESAT